MSESVGLGVPIVKRTNLSNIVFEEMKARIFSGTYKEGIILPTQDVLAKEFGVSRTVMRDAFHKLSSLGLVESQQGRGSFVRNSSAVTVMSSVLESFKMDEASIQDLMQARYYIEQVIVRLAASKASETELAFLKENLEAMEKAVAAGDLPLFASIDLDFHEKLSEMSRNVVLHKLLSIIREMMKKFFDGFSKTPGVVPRAVRYHQDIYKALQDKDADLAERKMKEHLKDIIINLEKNYKIRVII
ncbi:MAG: FadR/GntR family transcriptional regulator [Treponemataceae bacterium]